MRRSIFDILEEEMDLEYEIEVIMKLFDETRIYGFNMNYSLEDFFDQECIHLWQNRKYVTPSKQMRERLGITDTDIKEGLDEKQILILLEYILNVMSLCDAYMPEDSEWSKEFEMLRQNVVNIVNSLNYEVKVFEIGCLLNKLNIRLRSTATSNTLPFITRTSLPWGNSFWK